MGTSIASAIWSQKSQDFRAHPFKRPEKWISPHPNPYVQPHINTRNIGNFMDKRQETRKRLEISGPIQRWFIKAGEEWEGEHKRGGGLGGWGVGGSRLIVASGHRVVRSSSPGHRVVRSSSPGHRVVRSSSPGHRVVRSSSPRTRPAPREVLHGHIRGTRGNTTPVRGESRGEGKEFWEGLRGGGVGGGSGKVQ